jgi:hypothetical protein
LCTNLSDTVLGLEKVSFYSLTRLLNCSVTHSFAHLAKGQ